MQRIRTPLRAGLLALAATLPGLALAHMTWLLPNHTLVSGRDTTVSVDGAVSEDLFIFERALALGELRVTGPDGKTLPTGTVSSASHRNSFDVALPQEGTYRISAVSQSVMASYVVGTETKRFRGSLEALRKELPADAAVQGVSLQVNRQQTFVSREKPGTVAFAPEGQGLELLPRSAVTDLSDGDRSSFTLLLDGQPAAGVTLTLLREGNRYRYKRGDLTVQTDAQGQFTVTWPEPGRYWLGATVGDRPAPGGAGGTLEQPLRRAGLSATFEVQPR